MKIYFASNQATMLMRGGPTFKIICLRNALQKIGANVEFLNYWDTQLKFSENEFVHIFTANSGTYHLAESLKLYGTKYIVNSIFFSKHSPLKIKAYLFGQKLINNLLNGTMSEISMAREVCKNAELVLPNTDEENNIIKNGFGIPSQKLITIHNGVEKRFINSNPDYFEQKYNVKDFILHVGHIGADRKNTYNLLKALELLKHPAVIIGNILNNLEGKRCMAIIQNNPQILHLDWINHKDPILESAYAACNTFVLPSLYETPGRAALEAALAGAKIVITPHGGTKEYFNNLAEYCNPYSIKSISTTISNSLNSVKSDKLSDHISKNYLWDKIAEKTKIIYEKVMNTSM